MTATTIRLTAADQLADAAAFAAALSAVVEAPQAVDLATLKVELARRLGASARPVVELVIRDVFEGRQSRV